MHEREEFCPARGHSLGEHTTKLGVAQGDHETVLEIDPITGRRADNWSTERGVAHAGRVVVQKSLQDDVCAVADEIAHELCDIAAETSSAHDDYTNHGRGPVSRFSGETSSGAACRYSVVRRFVMMSL